MRVHIRVPRARRRAVGRRWVYGALAAGLAACVVPSNEGPPDLQQNIGQIHIAPRSATIGRQEAARFVAYGFVVEGDSFPATVTWAVNRWTISADGEFPPGADTGTYVVSATHPEKQWLVDSATLHVVGVSPQLERVVVLPANASLVLGESVDVRARGITTGGDTLVVDASWSATGGTITPQGIGVARYVPSQTGTHTVTATVGTVQGGTSVTVSPAPVASVTVSPTPVSVSVGQTVQLGVVLRDAGGNEVTGRSVAWSTGASAVATVSGSGLVTGQGVGTATITATSEGQTGTASVTVTTVPVASVTVSPTTLSLVVGQTGQLTATPRDAGGTALTGRGVSWSTSAPGVATVSTSGVVTGVGAGSATITATSEGQTATATVTVALAPVATVSVSPSAPSVGVGQSVQLSATLRDAAGNLLTGRTVSWSTSAAGVAAVSASGVVTGQGVGTATITATSEGQTGTAAVTVTAAPVASVSVTPSTLSLTVGQTGQLTATLRDASGNVLTGRTVTWTTTNAARATVSASGLVTAVGAGSATIRATSEGQTGSASVTVTTVPVATVSVSPSSLALDAGQTGQLSATLRDANGNVLTGRTVAWASSATGVATVNGSGVVTGQGAGTATITATSEGKSGTAAVTVTVVPVATVSVSPTSLPLAVRQSGQLTATARDANGNVLSGRVITWTTSASGVATVSSGGLVTGVGAGTATITATSEGKSGTAAVTVEEASAAYPNQPAGAIALGASTLDFGRLKATYPETASQPFSYVSKSNLSTVTDNAAPLNPTKVGAVRITDATASCSAGGGYTIGKLESASFFVPPSDVRVLYLSFYFKMTGSNPRVYVNGLKFFNVFGSTTTSILELWPTNYQTGAGPFGIGWVGQDGTRSPTFGTTSLNLVAERWYHVEATINYSTKVHTLWIDGEKRGEGTNSANMTKPEFFQWGWVYGGGPCQGSGQDWWMYHDEMYMAYTK
jgi:trimeric autotransporter adhesin